MIYIVEKNIYIQRCIYTLYVYNIYICVCVCVCVYLFRVTDVFFMNKCLVL